MASPRTQRIQPWLSHLVVAFAVIAAVLWLLPLASPHSVLFPPGPSFEDIIVYKGRFTVYHTMNFFRSRAFSGFAYPPGAAPIYEAFYKTSNPVQTYLILAAICGGLALAGTWYVLRRAGAGNLFLPIALILGFPFVFLVQRANIEIVLWLLIAIGIFACRQGYNIPAAFLFGIAASVKLYPILLLGFFLRRKRDLPAFLVGVVTAAVALIVAISYTGPNFLYAARGFFTDVGHFQDHYVDTVGRIEMSFDHCLFSLFKYWSILHHTSVASWRTIYYFAAGSFALLLFLRVRTLPFLNRAIFLTGAMVSLPPVSFTYTLVHLYAPLLFLLGALATFRSRPPATAVVALSLIVFLTLPLISLSVVTPLPAGPIQSCALFALLVISSFQAWPSTPRADAA